MAADKLRRQDRVIGRAAMLILVPTLLAVAVGAVLVAWPWPTVTVKGDPFIVGSAKVEQGGTITWQRQEACLPKGRTEVYRIAEPIDPADPRLLLEFDVGDFAITASEPVCFNPSVTPLTLPNTVAPGEWRIRIETVTDHPGPGDTRSVSYSPPFTVVP